MSERQAGNGLHPALHRLELRLMTDQEVIKDPLPTRTAVVPKRPIVSVWLRDLIISLGISAFIIIFLYQPVKVEGTSMMPSLDDQERIFVNKFVYRLESIQRGDIVVFRYPRDPSKSFIKRVIGLSGDRIRIDGGQVYVNGNLLDEDYIPPAYVDERSYKTVVVPQGCYFVLGDHRSLSNDSRDFGPVNASFIYGKAVFGYWPMDKLGRLR
jgi:signal peptidase I